MLQLLIPGFGTGVGGLDPAVASRKIFQAYCRANRRYHPRIESDLPPTVFEVALRQPSAGEELLPTITAALGNGTR